MLMTTACVIHTRGAMAGEFKYRDLRIRGMRPRVIPAFGHYASRIYSYVSRKRGMRPKSRQNRFLFKTTTTYTNFTPKRPFKVKDTSRTHLELSETFSLYFLLMKLFSQY